MHRTVGRSPMHVVAAVSAMLLIAGCHGPFSRVAPHARLDAVARLQLADGHQVVGTAFFVAPDVVVTARHVAIGPIFASGGDAPRFRFAIRSGEGGRLAIAPLRSSGDDGSPSRMEIGWADGRRVAVSGVLGDDYEADLVCLRLAAPVPGVTPIRLSSSAPAPGRAITVVGYPGGEGYATSIGRVRSSDATGWSRYAHQVETSAKGAPGSSGSPMFDESGEALAVVSGGTSDHSLVGVRADRVRPLLARPEIPWSAWVGRVRRSGGEWSHACAFAVARARAEGADARWPAEIVTRLGLATATAPFADERELWMDLLELQPDSESRGRVLRELDAWIAGRPGRTGARFAKIEFLFGHARYSEAVAEYDRFRAEAVFRQGMGAHAAASALQGDLPPRLDAAYEAVLDEPEWVFAWRILASSRWAAGDLGAWAPAFLRHEELRPDDPDAPNRVGALALALALEGSSRDALDAADEALVHEFSADNKRYARAAKALALAQVGEFARAEASIADVEALGAKWGPWFRAAIVELRRRATSPSK